MEGREGPRACAVHSRVAHFLSRVGMNVGSALPATGSQNATQSQESGKPPSRSRWWAERSGLPRSGGVGRGVAPLQRARAGVSRLTQLGPRLVKKALQAWHFGLGSELRGLASGGCRAVTPQRQPSRSPCPAVAWLLRLDSGSRRWGGCEASTTGGCSLAQGLSHGAQMFDPGPCPPCELRVGHQAAASLTQAPPRGQL